jgi:hypothetical protein
LIDVAANRRYQERFEARVGACGCCRDTGNSAVRVAALNDRDDSCRRSCARPKEFLAVRRGFLRADSVIALGRAWDGWSTPRRASSCSARFDADWQSAARLILAWLGARRNLARATALRDATVATLPDVAPLPLLRDRSERGAGRTARVRGDRAAAGAARVRP